MFKRKLYGKKHPATRDIQAQLKMWSLTNDAGEKSNGQRHTDNGDTKDLFADATKQRSKKDD